MKLSLLYALVVWGMLYVTRGKTLCTYIEEPDMQGDPSDWLGYITAASIAQCREYCTSNPKCTAAEMNFQSNSCYLYKDPTTRKQAKDHTFMHRICRELTSDNKALSTQHDVITASPTSSTTSTSVDKIQIITSATPNSLNSHTALVTVPTLSNGWDAKRFRRSSSTLAVPESSVSKFTPTVRSSRSFKQKTKSNYPASLVVKMLYASAVKDETDNKVNEAPSLSYGEISTTAATIARRGKTTKVTDAKKLKRRFSRPKGGSNTIKIRTTTPSSETSGPTPSVTTQQPIMVTRKPSTRQPAAIPASQETNEPGIVSKSIDLTQRINTEKEAVHIKSDKISSPQRLFRVSMKTSRYRPVSHETVRESNRADVIPAYNRQPARRCPSTCLSRNGVHTRQFIPLMKIYLPFMRPMNGFEPYRPGFRPWYHFRLPIRYHFPRLTYNYRFPIKPQWQQVRQRHVPPVTHPPQHADLAHNHRNPWANNFRRASLRSPGTKQVAVIPGGRYRPLTYRRTVNATPGRHTSTSAAPAVTGRPKSSDIFRDKLNDESTPQNQQSVSVRNGNDKFVRQNRQQWRLKSHYNTYTLRLTLPFPITGYKRCFSRQHLPPPPKILVVSFQQDGSFSAKSLPVHYPRMICAFITAHTRYPELHLPSPLVIFTGTAYSAGIKELRQIYNVTAPKAQYEEKSMQMKSNMYKFTSVYNSEPSFRKLRLPISIYSAMVSFDMTRMGFIYRFTVRLPVELESRNIMVEDKVQIQDSYMKVSPKSHMHGQ